MLNECQKCIDIIPDWIFNSFWVDINYPRCTADQIGLDDVVAADDHQTGEAAQVSALNRGQKTEAGQQTHFYIVASSYPGQVPRARHVGKTL